MTEILGDSGEYEFLEEAVKLSKHVQGMCLELGLRLGLGTKTIIDAVAHFCPDKIVVALDPYGSVMYKPREHMPECRLDYTLGMRNECLGNLYPYSQEKRVHFKFIELSDVDFFEFNKDGVIIYDLERRVENKYSMVHLDGPHSVNHVTVEVLWFNDRMSSGSVIVLDDCTPDFIRIEPINELFDSLGWSLYKQGVKKNIYLKV